MKDIEFINSRVDKLIKLFELMELDPDTDYYGYCWPDNYYEDIYYATFWGVVELLKYEQYPRCEQDIFNEFIGNRIVELKNQ